MAKNKRLTVDFDTESYYLDGEYWTSWDNYGEEMADKINDLLNVQDERIQELEKENEWLKKSIKRQQLSNEECSKYIEEVVKENKQLKSTNMEMEDYLGRLEEQIKED